MSVHTIIILLHWLHYSFPSFRGQQSFPLKRTLKSHGSRLPESLIWTSEALRALQLWEHYKKFFFLFLNWPSFMTSRAIKVQNILPSQALSKKLKKMFYLHNYHLLFKTGVTNSCAYSMLFVKVISLMEAHVNSLPCLFREC